MHAHGVEVLDRAHDDAVASAIAHDLHLVLFPALDGFLHEHLAGRRELEALTHDLAQLLLIVCDTTTRAAEGKARAQHAGVAHARHDSERVIDGISVTAAGNLQTDLGHGLIKELAVLAPLDGGKVAPDHLDAICIERAVLGQLHSGIEARLPTECGKQGVGTLSGDHLLDELWGHGLNIGAVRKPRVRHDRSRI